MFARIFGGKAKSEVRPTTSAAIGNLFELEERLTRKQDLLEQRAENVRSRFKIKSLNMFDLRNLKPPSKTQRATSAKHYALCDDTSKR